MKKLLAVLLVLGMLLGLILMVLFFVVQTVLEVQKLRGKDVSKIEEALNK